MTKPHVFRIEVAPNGRDSRVFMDGAELRSHDASSLVLEFVAVPVEVVGVFGEVQIRELHATPLPPADVDGDQ